jgi:excisionase family DNA binding protein
MAELPNAVMNAQEAADYLKMRVSTVKRLAAEGKIPARKVSGKGWRFLRATLDRWLANEI